MSTRPLATRALGQSGVRTSEVGFGSAPLGNLFQPVGGPEARLTLEAAWDAGVRYFDTAPFYGLGLSERRVGDALRGRDRDAFVLSTKVGRLLAPAREVRSNANRHGFCSPMPFEPRFDYSYSGVMRSFEDSLQRLGLARVDIALIHDIGTMTHGDDNSERFRTCMNGGYKALDELRSQGVIGAIGLGVNESEVCETAMKYGRFDCFLLAGRYTLLEQDALENFMPACERHGASLIIGGAYNSGILATGVRHGGEIRYNYAPAPDTVIERVGCLESICDDYNIPLAAAALQFPLAHPLVASVIPGLDSADRVAQAMTLIRKPIPDAFWDDLKNRQLVRQDAPVPGTEAGYA